MNKKYTRIMTIAIIVALVGLISGCINSAITAIHSNSQIQQSTQPSAKTQALSTTSHITTIASVTPKINKWNWLVPDDYGTLMEAVQVARDGDVIRLKAGKIAVGSGSIANRTLTIVGDGSDVTILDKGLIIQSSNITLEYLKGSAISFSNSNVTLDFLQVTSISLGNILQFHASNIECNSFSYQFDRNVPRTNSGAITIDNSVIGSMNVELENGVTNLGIDHCTLGQSPEISHGTLNLTGTLVNITHNDIFGELQISGLGHGIDYNTFENNANLKISGTSGNVSNNNIMCNRGSVIDNDDSTVWQSNYWEGWDSTKPVPISGTAKSE